jgi:hypothetical protein
MPAATPPGGRLPEPSAPAFPRYLPLRDPDLPGADPDASISFGSMETCSGDTGLSLWGGFGSTSADTASKVKLQLEPDRPVVIGRWDNGLPPYLDPSYRSTTIMPGTGQAVVRSATDKTDMCVSRAHFMLRGNSAGIVLTNGVPSAGGGIRPPTNGTWIVQPCCRLMGPAEEYQIENGAAVSLCLPNQTVVRICAEGCSDGRLRS